MAKEKGEHYVNNRDFSNSLVDYIVDVNNYIEGMLNNDPKWNEMGISTIVELRDHFRENKELIPNTPQLTEYIGSCFLKICQGLARKPNFIGYSYRGDMEMDAVENCVKAVCNYDIETQTRTGKPNAFGYFTMIAWRAFLRRIAKEKRQQEIKDRLKSSGNLDQYADFGGEGESIVNRIRSRDEYIKDAVFKPRKRVTKKNKGASIEAFMSE